MSNLKVDDKYLKLFYKSFDIYIELIKYLQNKLNYKKNKHPDTLLVEEFVNKITGDIPKLLIGENKFTIVHQTKQNKFAIVHKTKQIDLKGFILLSVYETTDKYIIFYNVDLKDWKLIENKLKNIIKLMTFGKSDFLCQYDTNNKISECFLSIDKNKFTDKAEGGPSGKAEGEPSGKDNFFRYIYHLVLPLIGDMGYKGYLKYKPKNIMYWIIITDILT